MKSPLESSTENAGPRAECGVAAGHVRRSEKIDAAEAVGLHWVLVARRMIQPSSDVFVSGGTR